MTSREKKKPHEKNRRSGKTSPPAWSPIARARRASRARNTSDRAQTRRTRPKCAYGRVRKKSDASGANRTDDRFLRGERVARRPERVPFLEDASTTRSRRRRESDARDIAVSFDRSRFPRNLGDRHKGARRRCTRRQTGHFGRDGRSARFARDRRRATRRRQIKNQQNKPWVARAYAPSFAALVSMCAAVFASGTFVVSSWIDSKRSGVRENSGSGRDARARRRRRRERRSNGKRYRRWLEIAHATRRGRAVPAPWPTPVPREGG